MIARPGARSIAGAIVLALGVLAAIAGTPEREEGHVTAIELAQWIRERRAGLRVVDIRSSEEFDAFHIPTAERLPLAELSRARFRSGETIVLYSEGGTHAAQGWVFLRGLGYTRVYFLRGGLSEWLDQVMSPALFAGANDSTRQEFARVAELSRYFGGTPTTSQSRSTNQVIPIPKARGSTSPSRAKVEDIRGRGC